MHNKIIEIGIRLEEKSLSPISPTKDYSSPDPSVESTSEHDHGIGQNIPLNTTPTEREDFLKSEGFTNQQRIDCIRTWLQSYFCPYVSSSQINLLLLLGMTPLNDTAKIMFAVGIKFIKESTTHSRK